MTLPTSSPQVDPPPPGTAPMDATAVDLPLVETPAQPAKTKRRLPLWAILGAGAVVTLGIGAGVFVAVSDSDSSPTTTSANGTTGDTGPQSSTVVAPASTAQPVATLPPKSSIVPLGRPPSAAPQAPAPPAAKVAKSDQRYATCEEAIKHGLGPYKKGTPEYTWYADTDNDGVVCTR